jgi:hypothetical protein
MGLLNFWKKKASDQLVVPPLDTAQLSTDLPPIDGDSNIDSIDGSNVQTYGNMQQLPIDNLASIDGSKSISFNIPTLDFSLPPKDDAPSSTGANTIPELPTSLSASEESKTFIDEEDLNHLFINDDAWKEPDWNNFEPYPEDKEKIDEPKSEDFKGADLPGFDDATGNGQVLDEPILEPKEFVSIQKKSGIKPVELFIRGRAYNRVFIELDQMNHTLTKIDSQVDRYEEMLKREEPLLIVAKDQMEYLYKRLNLIDKKIFAQ